MEKRHFYDGLMYYPQQLQQCSCSFIIEFMNWYFMWFLRACVDPLHTLMWAPSWCTWGSVQTVRPHYLQNTHTLGILGGLASQFSCYRLIRFRLNYSHRCTAMTFNYCHFSRVNLLFISNVFFFQDFISSKIRFFWGGDGGGPSSEFFHYPTRYYSTTRLWGHYPTLPYSKLKNHYS